MKEGATSQRDCHFSLEEALEVQVMAAIAHNKVIKHARILGCISSMRRSDTRVPENEFGELVVVEELCHSHITGRFRRGIKRV